MSELAHAGLRQPSGGAVMPSQRVGVQDATDFPQEGEEESGKQNLLNPDYENLSDAEIAGVRACFNKWDVNNSGSLTMEELMTLWTQDGTFAHLAARLEDLFEEVDADGDKSITIDEFLNVINIRVPTAKQGDEARDATKLFVTALENLQEEIEAVYGSNAKPISLKDRQDQIAHDMDARTCFFAPSSTFRTCWDALQVTCLLFVGISVPLRVAFSDMHEAGPTEFLFWFEVGLDSLFIFDLFVNFRTAYVSSIGDVIIDNKKITLRYLKGWFLIDGVACFPVKYLAMLIAASRNKDAPDGDATALIKGLKILRLLRLAKMLRLGHIVRKIKHNDTANGGSIYPVVRVLVLVLIICFIAHFFACAWYMVGQNSWEYGTKGTAEYEEVQGWAKARNWMAGTTTVSIGERYTDAFYFTSSTLTTVGFGDIHPVTQYEKVFVIIIQLVGGIVFGILAGTLSAMLVEGSAMDAKLEEHNKELNEFLIAKRVSKTVREDVMSKMSAKGDNSELSNHGAFDETEVLGRLPPKIRKQLLHEMYYQQIARCPLFEGQPETLLHKLCMHMQPYYAMENDIIQIEGGVELEMYMIESGTIRMSSSKVPKLDNKVWEVGAFFGELPVLDLGDGVNRNQAWYSAEAMCDCQLCYIGYKHIEKMKHDFPQAIERLRALAVKRALKFDVSIPAEFKTADYLQLARTSKASLRPRALTLHSLLKSPRNLDSTILSKVHMHQTEWTNSGNRYGENKHRLSSVERALDGQNTIDDLSAKMQNLERMLHTVLQHVGDAEPHSRPREAALRPDATPPRLSATPTTPREAENASSTHSETPKLIVASPGRVPRGRQRKAAMRASTSPTRMESLIVAKQEQESSRSARATTPTQTHGIPNR